MNDIYGIIDSMKNHGAEHVIEPMFELGRETMRLPYDDKMKFWQGNSGGSFGFVLSLLVIQKLKLSRVGTKPSVLQPST